MLVAEWRQIQFWTLPGHDFQVIPSFEMGEGVSGISIYCLTCDDERSVMHCAFWDWQNGEPVYTHNEAMLELRKAAMRHWKERQNA